MYVVRVILRFRCDWAAIKAHSKIFDNELLFDNEALDCRLWLCDKQRPTMHVQNKYLCTQIGIYVNLCSKKQQIETMRRVKTIFGFNENHE